MVSTLDFESKDPSSSLGRTSFFNLQIKNFKYTKSGLSFEKMIFRKLQTFSNNFIELHCLVDGRAKQRNIGPVIIKLNCIIDIKLVTSLPCVKLTS